MLVSGERFRTRLGHGSPFLNEHGESGPAVPHVQGEDILISTAMGMEMNGLTQEDAISLLDSIKAKREAGEITERMAKRLEEVIRFALYLSQNGNGKNESTQLGEGGNNPGQASEGSGQTSLGVPGSVDGSGQLTLGVPDGLAKHGSSNDNSASRSGAGHRSKRRSSARSDAAAKALAQSYRPPMSLQQTREMIALALPENCLQAMYENQPRKSPSSGTTSLQRDPQQIQQIQWDLMKACGDCTNVQPCSQHTLPKDGLDNEAWSKSGCFVHRKLLTLKDARLASVLSREQWGSLHLKSKIKELKAQLDQEYDKRREIEKELHRVRVDYKLLSRAQEEGDEERKKKAAQGLAKKTADSIRTPTSNAYEKAVVQERFRTEKRMRLLLEGICRGLAAAATDIGAIAEDLRDDFQFYATDLSVMFDQVNEYLSELVQQERVGGLMRAELEAKLHKQSGSIETWGATAAVTKMKHQALKTKYKKELDSKDGSSHGSDGSLAPTPAAPKAPVPSPNMSNMSTADPTPNATPGAKDSGSSTNKAGKGMFRKAVKRVVYKADASPTSPASQQAAADAAGSGTIAATMSAPNLGVAPLDRSLLQDPSSPTSPSSGSPSSKNVPPGYVMTPSRRVRAFGDVAEEEYDENSFEGYLLRKVRPLEHKVTVMKGQLEKATQEGTKAANDVRVAKKGVVVQELRSLLKSETDLLTSIIDQIGIHVGTLPQLTFISINKEDRFDYNECLRDLFKLKKKIPQAIEQLLNDAAMAPQEEDHAEGVGDDEEAEVPRRKLYQPRFSKWDKAKRIRALLKMGQAKMDMDYDSEMVDPLEQSITLNTNPTSNAASSGRPSSINPASNKTPAPTATSSINPASNKNPAPTTRTNVAAKNPNPTSKPRADGLMASVPVLGLDTAHVPLDENSSQGESPCKYPGPVFGGLPEVSQGQDVRSSDVGFIPIVAQNTNENASQGSSLPGVSKKPSAKRTAAISGKTSSYQGSRRTSSNVPPDGSPGQTGTAAPSGMFPAVFATPHSSVLNNSQTQNLVAQAEARAKNESFKPPEPKEPCLSPLSFGSDGPPVFSAAPMVMDGGLLPPHLGNLTSGDKLGSTISSDKLGGTKSSDRRSSDVSGFSRNLAKYGTLSTYTLVPEDNISNTGAPAPISGHHELMVSRMIADIEKHEQEFKAKMAEMARLPAIGKPQLPRGAGPAFPGNVDVRSPHGSPLRGRISGEGWSSGTNYRLENQKQSKAAAITSLINLSPEEMDFQGAQPTANPNRGLPTFGELPPTLSEDREMLRYMKAQWQANQWKPSGTLVRHSPPRIGSGSHRKSIESSLVIHTNKVPTAKDSTLLPATAHVDPDPP